MATQRLAQIGGHISNSLGRGLLAGEVAIITGAAQGIGKNAALLFAKEGAKVVVSDLDEKKAQAVVDEIKAAGGQAIAVGGDVSAEEFPDKIIGETIRNFGKLNHIVNNAGFTFDKMLHTMNDDAFDLIMKVHVRAPFRLVRAAAPHLRIKDAAVKENRSIINAKSAITGFTKTIAKEWGPFGVRANTVAFGYIETRLTAAKENNNTIEVDGKKIALGIPSAQGGGKMSGANNKPVPGIPLGRAGTPEEAAASVLFLASPLASYVSGHTLEVTGGSGI